MKKYVKNAIKLVLMLAIIMIIINQPNIVQAEEIDAEIYEPFEFIIDDKTYKGVDNRILTYAFDEFKVFMPKILGKEEDTLHIKGDEYEIVSCCSIKSWAGDLGKNHHEVPPKTLKLAATWQSSLYDLFTDYLADGPEEKVQYVNSEELSRYYEDIMLFQSMSVEINEGLTAIESYYNFEDGLSDEEWLEYKNLGDSRIYDTAEKKQSLLNMRKEQIGRNQEMVQFIRDVYGVIQGVELDAKQTGIQVTMAVEEASGEGIDSSHEERKFPYLAIISAIVGILSLSIIVNRTRKKQN